MPYRVIVFKYERNFQTYDSAMTFAYSLVSEGCYSSFSISPIPQTEMVTTSKPIQYFSTSKLAVSLAEQYGDVLQDCPFVRLLELTQAILDELRDCDYTNADLLPFLAGLLTERSRKRS